MHLLFFEFYKKRFLGCKEHGNLLNKLSSMVHGQTFHITSPHLHREGSPYLPRWDAPSSSVDLSPVNLFFNVHLFSKNTCFFLVSVETISSSKVARQQIIFQKVCKKLWQNINVWKSKSNFMVKELKLMLSKELQKNAFLAYMTNNK